MPDVHAKDGSVHIAISGDPDELTPDEARQLAHDLTAAAASAEQQLRTNWALCEAEGHDWSTWFNGYNPWRNHFRHCQRPGCLEPHEQYPGWMPFAARPHADMFGPRQCSGPGCDHCETEQFGKALSGFLREAAAGMAGFLDDASEVRG